jgi:hypothetical protein
MDKNQQNLANQTAENTQSVGQSTNTPGQQPREMINKDTIRPSHIQDESILYKTSGYLKDLIGEGK